MSAEQRPDTPEAHTTNDELATSWNEAVASLEARYRRISILNHATAVLAIVLLAFCALLWQKTSETVENNRHALCTFRLDLESRMATTEEWLHEHPNGIAGITAASVKVSLFNQKRTVLALGDINCVQERNQRLREDLAPSPTPPLPPTPTATVRNP